MKTFAFALLALALSTQARAASVCLVDAEADVVSCDGKQLQSFSDDQATYSKVLLAYLTKGYKIVSQSSRGDYPFWTLVKD